MVYNYITNSIGYWDITGHAYLDGYCPFSTITNIAILNDMISKDKYKIAMPVLPNDEKLH